MHGRPLLLAAAALVACAATATPALADETLSLGQAATVDGVVTSWQIQSAAGQTVRLRSTQALLSSTATTAIDEPVEITASPQTVAARLPIAAGGELSLVGAGGSPQVTATVEPDADGDGYGDTTQDACPGDFVDDTAPCDGTATIGSPLTLAPDPRGFSPSGTSLQALQLSAAGTTSTVAEAGVLTSWRLRADPTKGDTVLQLLRPTGGGGAYTVVDETAAVHATSTDVVTLADQLAVQAGDRLAVRSVLNGTNRDLGVIAQRSSDQLVYRPGPATTESTWTPDATVTATFRLLVQADVEPDADHDGKGDVTQDGADLVLSGGGAAEVGALDGWSHTYTIRNAGPDTALGVVLTIGGAGVVPGSVPAGATCADANPAVIGSGVVCKLAALATGASVSIAPGLVTPSIYPPPSGTFSTQASVTAATPDPVTTNNAASLRTVVDPAPPYNPYIPPQTPFVVKPCTNVIRGTRDDDVLRGTAFGDRLVGGDGDDLLKGNGADDCLEGGTGDDVLDGGDGNDRLAGSSGRDRMTGGTGDDKLTGGKGNDRLIGGPGNDTISPGDGHDVVDAGSGNDTINSVDGVKETIECGAGKDTVRADKRDRLKHCEKVTRR
jgi:Ca2+-binding RTX toxin-like protein